MPPCSLARQFWSFASVAIFGICATGCVNWFDEVFDDNVSLSEFAPVGATVSVERGEMSRSQLVLDGKDGVCLTMADDISARVNDRSMDVFIRGGQTPLKEGGWECSMPTFRRNVSVSDGESESARFVVEDDTAKFTVIATGLLKNRTIAPTVKDVPIEPGVETSFDWSVTTDVIDPERLVVDFVYDDAALSLPSTLKARVDGSLVHIQFPVDAPDGTGKLHVDVTAEAPIETCEGLPACSASVHAVAEVALEILKVIPPSP
jgi:hypothetical protein